MDLLEYVSANWTQGANIQALLRISFLVVLYAVVAATVLSVVLGVVLYTNELTPRSWRRSVRIGSQDGLLIASALALTVPSYALLGLLQKPFGTGATILIVALVVYGMYPVLRNVVAGLSSVDPAVLEAAKGVGMGATRRMLRIQLPLAWPVIVSGVRVATLILLAIHVVGGFFGAPGLPNLIADGIAGRGGVGWLNQVLVPTLGCLVLAAVFEVVFILIQKLTTPRGIRA